MQPTLPRNLNMRDQMLSLIGKHFDGKSERIYHVAIPADFWKTCPDLAYTIIQTPC
jgi:hypothetical protein